MTHFTKYQALGNDYVVIDPRDAAFEPTGQDALLLCDRNFGIGADGVLFGPIGPVHASRPVRLRIFNSDGSECEKSGNGIRIFALHVAARHLPGVREFTVRTLCGDSSVRIVDQPAGVVSVGMGGPCFDAAAVPMLGITGLAVEQPLLVDGRQLTVTALNLGNPHAVVLTEHPTRELACALGPLIAEHERFPTRTNVQFLRVLDRRTIQIEVWERGAGYTLASGSSGCAATAVAHRLGQVDTGAEITVRMAGGEIGVTVAPDGTVTMTGSAEHVLSGTLAAALVARLGNHADQDAAVPHSEPAGVQA